MLSLALLGLLLFVTAVVRLGQWDAVRRGTSDGEEAPAPSPAQRAWTTFRARRTPTAPLLPEGHRPPVGLGPLSPSERFLRSEAARGIRALQLWLLDEDGASA